MSDITRNINKLTTSLPTLSRVLAGACFCTLALLVHDLFKETDNATKVLIIKSTTSHKSYHPVFLLMKTIVDMSPTLYGNSHVQIIVKFFLFFCFKRTSTWGCGILEIVWSYSHVTFFFVHGSFLLRISHLNQRQVLLSSASICWQRTPPLPGWACRPTVGPRCLATCSNAVSVRRCASSRLAGQGWAPPAITKVKKWWPKCQAPDSEGAGERASGGGTRAKALFAGSIARKPQQAMADGFFQGSKHRLCAIMRV